MNSCRRVHLTPSYVRGVQSQKVLAVVKHLVANNQETNRDRVNSVVDDRALWEVYYPPFEAAVKAGVGAAMCSYSRVNGVRACDSRQILTKDLKEAMGFSGFVQSDWLAVEDSSAEAGVDQEMPGDSSPEHRARFTDASLRALSDGRIDDMTRRQLSMIYRHQLFDRPPCQAPQCDVPMYEAVATTPELQHLSRELARKSVVLLKNEHTVLPLSPGPNTKIALIGPACNAEQDVQHQLEDWMASSYYNIGGSGRVIAANVTTMLSGIMAVCAKPSAG